MPAMLSLEKNFTSGSSSAAFSRSLVSSFSRQSSPTRFPTFLQHLTASMRRLGTLSSHISRMCGQSLACSSSSSRSVARMEAPSSSTARSWKLFSALRSSSTGSTCLESHAFGSSKRAATLPMVLSQSVRMRAQLSVAQPASWPANSALNSASPMMPASLGKSVRVEWRTRQFLSWQRRPTRPTRPLRVSPASVIPMTSVRAASLPIMSRRTLLFSSPPSSSWETVGKTSSNAMGLPRGPAMSMSTPASSIRWIEFGSSTRSFSIGKMGSRPKSAPSTAVTPAARSAVAMRTSASWSRCSMQ
mmetsp:Transcript_5844/g.13598  ORF Transcript_5844/g.13598 Transcript_5844/m.13598 type:complete len:302 (-) Transcript_5844:924-1829(-)